VITNTFGFTFINSSGTTITSLTIQYTGEQWRNGDTAAADKLDFQIGPSSSSITAGTFQDVDALDFTGPVVGTTAAATDGNSASNRTTLTFTITGLNILPGQTFSLRWIDSNVVNNDDGLGIDDFSLQIAGTTAVNMSSFRAVSFDRGVALEWTTGFEVNNLGFKVYRERKGKRVPINHPLSQARL